MRRVALTAIAVAAICASSPVEGGGKEIGADTGSDGDITVRAVSGVVYTEGGDGGPRCTWDRYTVGRLEDSLGIPPPALPEYEVPDEELTPEELDRRNVERAAGTEAERVRREQVAIKMLFGEPHYLYDVRCPGFSGVLRAVPTDVTATDLIPGVEDVAHGRIEPPIPNVSPALDATGYVNLGMWLAIEPVSVAPISAEAGPSAWITVRPQHESITFDFGNGDSVTCPGTGTPITDLDTHDQGPCGYTYRTSSADDERAGRCDLAMVSARVMGTCAHRGERSHRVGNPSSGDAELIAGKMASPRMRR